MNPGTHFFDTTLPAPDIGVLLPTRNSMALLPRHIETMRRWLDLVEEVVVVDSESTDGTVELLRRELTGPKVRLFDHPRGLYQSWNSGIRQMRSRFTYISTVGDEMTRAGLVHLAEVARQFDCDVVISKPDFVDEQDRSVDPHRWPIDTMIEVLGINAPVVLQGLAVRLFAVALCPGAILGSSASNLYRTGCLQERPFPTEYGTVGDGAWGMMNAHQIRLGITPRRDSFFREHAKSYSSKEYAVESLSLKLLRAATDVQVGQVIAKPHGQQEESVSDLRQLEAVVERALECQRRLERVRHQAWPWVLNPIAWAARCQRDKANQLVATQLVQALKRLQAADALPPALRINTKALDAKSLGN